MSTRPTIDWQSVKNSIQANEASLAESLVAVAGDRLEQAYLQRARFFASRSTALGKQSGTCSVLTFTVGAERLCIDLAMASEILPYAQCSPIPGAEPQLLGVVNVRGRICSVLDLARILELPQESREECGYIVLVRHAGLQVGLKVDRVEQVETVLPEELADSREDLSGTCSAYIQSRTASRAGLLNVAAVFSHPVFHPTCKAAATAPHGVVPESHAQRVAAPSF